LQKLLKDNKQLQVVNPSSGAPTAASGKPCSSPSCERVGTLRCARCHRSMYCSVECQKADWKFHKTNICNPAPAPAAATANTASKPATADTATSTAGTSKDADKDSKMD